MSQVDEKVAADEKAAAELKAKEEETAKTIPYERFKEVNAKLRETENKLAEFVAKTDAEKKAAEEKKAKEEGDYTTLMQRITAEREAEKQKINGMVATTFLTTLASKNGILKEEYLKLFPEQVEIENLEIKNAAKLEESFTKFKLENPTLFTADKAVPKTDSTPVKKVDNSIDPSKLSSADLFKLGLEERRNKK
jgi:hypothetical protein